MGSKKRHLLRNCRSTLKFIIQKTKNVLVCFLLLYAFHILLSKTSILRPSYNPLVHKYVKLQVKEWGLNGQAVILNNLTEYQRALVDRSTREYQINAWLSDRIPLTRSLPDFRDKRCPNFTSHKDLPSASIIIIYHDDHPSVLLRCLFSIVMRSLPDKVKDIILVDVIKDHVKSGYANIRALVSAHFGRRVRYLKFNATTGDVAARDYGAQHARGDVLVFLEASIEVTVGWLPPLLEPIAANKHAITLPTLDEIHFNTFAYRKVPSERGGFNWKLSHKYLPLLPTQNATFPAPYQNPVMNGPLFAISKGWYWRFSSYDVGLKNWGGEFFELSFMFWMCDSIVYEVPCSRIGYLNKDAIFETHLVNETYMNYARIADVWMDEFGDTIYIYRENMLYFLYPEDFGHQHNFRKQMKCKSFKWYLDNVMPDFMRAFPPESPFSFAHGTVKFLGNSKYCLISAINGHEQKETPNQNISAMLDYCPKVSQNALLRFNWRMGHYTDVGKYKDCLDFNINAKLPTPVVLQPCHQNTDTQLWYYHTQSHSIQSYERSIKKLCLYGDTEYFNVFVKECDFGDPNQCWLFNHINQTALDDLKGPLKFVNAVL